MVDKDDWRLQGQERYLKGVSLSYEKYSIYRKDWEHDHCEFCSKKFTESIEPDVLNYGYTTEDHYRWICSDCFNDFKALFEWKLT